MDLFCVLVSLIAIIIFILMLPEACAGILHILAFDEVDVQNDTGDEDGAQNSQLYGISYIISMSIQCPDP